MRWTVVAQLLLAATATAHPKEHDDCKCLPGDKCWPKQKEWDKLNKKVDGRLQATVPLAQPCHGDNFDEAACAELQEEWTFSSIQYVTNPIPNAAPDCTNDILPPAPCRGDLAFQ